MKLYSNNVLIIECNTFEYALDFVQNSSGYQPIWVEYNGEYKLWEDFYILMKAKK